MSEPLDPHLEPAYDEARIASTWKKIAARRWPAARPPRRWLIAGAVVAAAIAIAIVAWPGARPPGPLTTGDPAASVAPGAIWTGLDHDVVLDDESTISLAAGGRLAILANEGTRFATQLQAGSAHFDVHPGGPRRWEIETALASVEVVGTAFTVDVGADQLVVGVERGVVLVHGELVPGRVARLTAGMRLVVRPAIASALPEPSAPSPPVAPAVHREAPARPPIAHVAELPAAAVKPASLAEVIAQADLLSSSGDAAGAAALLERYRGSSDPAAGLAVFMLGRLYLDALDKPALAAAAFGDVIARGDPKSLVEDAYAREIEAFVHAGDRAQALRVFAGYEKAYPHGRRLSRIRTLLGL